MARIQCTVVETSTMSSSFDVTPGDPSQAIGSVPSEQGFCQDGEFESRLEPAYCELLPWADPYIASLVHELHAASGAMLPHGWPRGTAPEPATDPSAQNRAKRRRQRPENGSW